MFAAAISTFADSAEESIHVAIKIKFKGYEKTSATRQGSGRKIEASNDDKDAIQK